MPGKSLRNLEQKRASFAWKNVEKVAVDTRKEYSSWVKKLPAMIMTNGLGQTLAFLKSREEKDPEKKLLYEHISEWLIREDAPIAWADKVQEKSDLLERIIDQNTTIIIYRQAAQEALAFIAWLKRFAEAKADEKNTDT